MPVVTVFVAGQEVFFRYGGTHADASLSLACPLATASPSIGSWALPLMQALPRPAGVVQLSSLTV